MQSDLVPLSALSARDLAAWDELGQASIVPNPFHEPAFVLPSTGCWGVGDVHLLVVREGDQWLAALPVRARNSWLGVPGRMLAVWRHPYCYLGNPLVTADRPELALAELLRRGLTAAPALGFEWIDTEGPGAEVLALALLEVGRPIQVGAFERAALYRRDTADYLERAVSRRQRKEYTRKRTRLEAEIGPVTLRDQADDPSAFERFLALEAAGWKGEQGTALASQPEHRAFFIAMTEAFARAGRLQMLAMASDTQTVAMQCDLVAGDTSFSFKIAMDEGFRRFSPGIQLFIDNLEPFHASTLRWTDSCGSPSNASLNRLWADRRRLRNVVLARPGQAGMVNVVKWRAALRAADLRTKVEPMRARLRKSEPAPSDPPPNG